MFKLCIGIIIFGLGCFYFAIFQACRKETYDMTKKSYEDRNHKEFDVTRERWTADNKKLALFMLIASIAFVGSGLFLCVGGFSSSSGSGRSSIYVNSQQVKCQSCGRVFDKSSSNGKSIKRTHLCTNCYNNMGIANNYLKEMPK